MARPTKVEITEVGPRDGLQAELNFIPTDAKIRFVNGLIAAGVPRSNSRLLCRRKQFHNCPTWSKSSKALSE